MNNMLVSGISLHQGSFKDESSGQQKSYDFAKIYVLAPMEDKSNTKRGLNVVEYRCESSVYAKIKDCDFPQEMDLNISMMSDGKNGMSVKVLDVTPTKKPTVKAA